MQHTPKGRLSSLTARSTQRQSVNTKQFKGAWEIDPPDNRQFLCSDDSCGQPNNHKNEKRKRKSTAEKLWFGSRCTGYYCRFTSAVALSLSLWLSCSLLFSVHLDLKPTHIYSNHHFTWDSKTVTYNKMERCKTRLEGWRFGAEMNQKTRRLKDSNDASSHTMNTLVNGHMRFVRNGVYLLFSTLYTVVKCT